MIYPPIHGPVQPLEKQFEVNNIEDVTRQGFESLLQMYLNDLCIVSLDKSHTKYLVLHPTNRSTWEILKFTIQKFLYLKTFLFYGGRAQIETG